MGEQLFQAVRFEQPVQKSVDDDLVQRLHADALAGAAGGSPHNLRGAGIVAVLAALAGPDGQTLAAARHGANGDAGQKDGAIGDPRRRLGRRSLGPERRDLLGVVGFDDAGARNPNPVLRLGDTSLIIGGLVRVGTAVVRPMQNAVHARVEEGFAAERIAMAVQPFADRPGAHRLTGEAMARKRIDAPHDLGLGFDDEQLLALLVAITVHGLGAVAERNDAAIPVAVERVLAAITPGEERRVVRVFLVHDGDHAAHHLGVGVLAEILGHRDQLHASFLELVLGGDLGQQSPREPRQIVDDDDVHRPLGAGRGVDHLVELFAGKLAARDSDILKDMDEFDPLALGIGGDGVALAGDAGIVAILLVDGNASVAERQDLRLLLGHF